MTRNVDQFLNELKAMTPTERQVFKTHYQLTDLFGLDVVEELIGILIFEQENGTQEIEWTTP